MNRAVTAIVLGALGACALGAVLVKAAAVHDRSESGRCGRGFVASAGNCLVALIATDAGCPSPLVATGSGCDAPEVRVLVPETRLSIGPSDWEAEGLVTARTIHVAPFRIDAFEVTERDYLGVDAGGESARAASGMTRDAAQAFCAARGGRLPNEDEWIAAAAAPEKAAMDASAPSARRYPWGETGAVCRRAAWGLSKGPCGTGATGPDAVGAHPDGDSRLGLHDLAGNVAEWVAPASASAPAVAKGGSWQSALASELRTWARLELPPGRSDPRVGFRCVYSP